MGSNRLLRYRTNASTVPTVTTALSTSTPPKPTITAMPITPVNSTNGKYFDEMRTVSRLASYWCSFVRPKRRIQPASCPKACTTRTPSSPSCNVARFSPIASRTSR